jgi:hypothetical protein
MPRQILTPEQRNAREDARYMARFGAACDAMHRRAHHITAAIVIDPSRPKDWGRIVLTQSARDSAGTVSALAWMPGNTTAPDCTYTHHGRSGAVGADRETLALVGAQFLRPDGARGSIVDSSRDWRTQLEDAGFVVAMAV